MLLCAAHAVGFQSDDHALGSAGAFTGSPVDGCLILVCEYMQHPMRAMVIPTVIFNVKVRFSSAHNKLPEPSLAAAGQRPLTKQGMQQTTNVAKAA